MREGVDDGVDDGVFRVGVCCVGVVVVDPVLLYSLLLGRVVAGV